MKKILGLFIAMLFSSQTFAESTIFQTVTLVNFDASANGALYFRGDAKWGAASCSNATYVQIKADECEKKGADLFLQISSCCSDVRGQN